MIRDITVYFRGVEFPLLLFGTFYVDSLRIVVAEFLDFRTLVFYSYGVDLIKKLGGKYISQYLDYTVLVYTFTLTYTLVCSLFC